MPSSFDVTANVNLNSRNLNASAKKIELALGRITGQASEFQKSLDASTARVFAFGATTAVLNGVNQAFKKLVSTTIEVQKRLVEINSIFQANEKVFNQFRNAIFQVAKETGQAFNTVSEGAAELARQGLSAEETAKRLKASLVLTRISGLDAEKSVKALTAAINGFASAGLSANQIVNKLVAVDTAFAVSAQDLAEAFSRAGSTAEDAGVSFDQLLGLVTAVEQKTARGGAVIGNAFKSIFTRLSRGDTIESLKELGVQIDASQNGVQKLSALSAALENISDPTVASQIKELAGGVFQINVVSAALKDLSSETSIFAGAAQVASDATNEAFSKNAELNKTIAAQINSLIAGLTSLAERIGSITFGPLLENLIGLTTKFTEFLDKALDPEKGNVFIKGLFKTIGTFLSGPAVVIFTTAFIKIFALVAKFAKDGLKSVFAIGSESTKIKNIEAGIVGLLQKDKSLRKIITSTTATQAQKEQAVINAIKAENALLRQQATLVQSIAVAARSKGVASFSGATGQFKGRRGKGFASGFQQEEAMAMGLGASGGVKAHFGQGTIGGRRFIMNNQEMEIPNFAGGRDSAVIPMYPAGNPLGYRKPKSSSKSTGSAAGAASQKKKNRTLFLEGQNYGMLVAKKGDYSGGQVSTSKITGPTQNAISALGISNPKGIKKIVLSGLNVRSIGDSTPSFRGQFAKTVTKEFSGPLINFGSKMIGDTFKNDEKANITNKLKKQKGTKLFSSSTEGGIFESAIRMGLAGMNAAAKFNQNASETAPFDFEEGGRADKKFKRRFRFPANVSRADAKRSSTGDAARSFIHKILQDGQAKRFANPRVKMAARGHIPRYAKGSQGGVGGGGALAGLLALDIAMNTFQIGIDKTTGEMNALGKAANMAMIALTSLSALSALSDLKGLFGGAKGRLGKLSSMVKGSTFMRGMKHGRGAGLTQAGSVFTGFGPQKAGLMQRAGARVGQVGRGIKGGFTAARAGLAAKAGGGILGKSVIGGAGKLAAAMGPVGGIIAAGFVASVLAAKLGQKIGEKIIEKGTQKEAKRLNTENRTGFGGAASAEQRFIKNEFMGMTGAGGAKSFDELFKNNAAAQKAILDYSKALSEAAALSKTGRATDQQMIDAEKKAIAELEKATGFTKGVGLRHLEINKELAELSPRLSKYRRALGRATQALMFSASEGVRKSGLGVERSGIMSGLNLADGPNAQAVAARIGVGSATSQAGQSLSALRALQAEASITDPNSDRGKELQKELLEAGAKFREDVISGAVGFKNNITALNKSLTEKLKEERALVTKRGEASISRIGRFSETVGAVAGQKDFEKLQKAIEESRGGQDTRNIISRALSDPKFQNAANVQGMQLEKMLTMFFNRGSSVQGLAGRRMEEAAAGAGGGFDAEIKKMFADATGTNFDEQSKALSGEIADLSNAIAENKQGLSNFLASFNTDTAKGVVNLVETISTDLNNSVQGVTKVSEATKQIDKVNEGVVGLATETASLITKTAGNIKTLMGKVATIEEQIANLNLEKKGGGLQSPENPAPAQ